MGVLAGHDRRLETRFRRAGWIAEHEYLRQVPTVTDIPEALRSFARRIPDFQPDSWITHVSGHPPGALLTFVWLDRIGLGGGAWAGALCLLVGFERRRGDRRHAAHGRRRGDRPARAAPFVAVAPTAIWIAVSADGYFTGVAAWGIALLALACTARCACPRSVAAAAGLLLGWAIFLNYGLASDRVAGGGGAVSARTPPRRVDDARVGNCRGAGGGRGFRVGGLLVVRRLHPCAATVLAGHRDSTARSSTGAGPTWRRWCARSAWAASPASAEAFDVAAIRRRSGIHLLVLAALTAILCADLSMLSKAETERIWLPFTSG